MANEFEDVKEENEFLDGGDVPPTIEKQDDLISASGRGTVYDWSKAPDAVKAPPRINMNGKTVSITKADILLPPTTDDWEKTRDGTKNYKYCRFILYYDFEAQQEALSGVRVFKKDDNKYSHPTITRDRNNQASALLGLYADKAKKDINEISLREFLGFLNSKPKAVIKVAQVKNPATNETINKNIIEKFI
jgi:hypothetical protein